MSTPSPEAPVGKFGNTELTARGAILGQDRSVHRLTVRPSTAWLLLGLGLAATVLASVSAWRQVRSRDEARFLVRTEALRNDLLQELDRHVRLLRDVRALWRIHPPGGHDEWQVYTEGLDLAHTFSGLHTLGFIERVPSTRLPDFVEQVRQDRSRGPEVARFRVHPQTSSDEHYVVRFVAPLHSNHPALGYDIASDPVRRHAAERARDTGEATLTQMISLVQVPRTPGVLLLLPVYSPSLEVTNLDQRRADVVGWVYTAFVFEDLLAQVQRSQGKELHVQICDGVSSWPGSGVVGSEDLPGSGARRSRASFERTTHLRGWSAHWTLRFREGPAFGRTPMFSAPGYVVAAGLGLCISLLIFWVARSSASVKRRAVALADEMTAKLRLQHHAMACAKNGLFILDARRADCPIIYANPAFERMTGYSVDQPLGDKTSLLLRNRVGQTDLPGVRAALQAGGSDPAIVREYRTDGSQFWAEFRLLPVLDEHGQRTHFLGIAEDITERKRSGEQLARAEQRYHELLNNLTVGVYRNTPGEHGRFLEVNPALVAMFEATSREELMGYGVSDLYVNPARRSELSEKLLREGFLKGEEFEAKSLRGLKFWVSVTAVRKQDDAGHVFLDGVVEDITDRKYAEESLRRERRLLRTVLDNLPDVIYVKDTAGRKTLANLADVQIMGCQTEAEALGKTDLDFYPPEAAAGFMADDQSVIQTGHPVLNREESFVGAHGRARWLLTSKLPLRDESGGVIGLVGIGHNITERRLAEQALRESQERFALAVQGTNDGIWDWNVVTNEVYFSPRWKSMLGYAEHEVENTFVGWQRLLHPEDRERALARIQDYFVGRTSQYELEHRLRHKDGSYRWILARGVALRDAEGRPLRMAGSHLDLTERRHAEEELRRANRDLARSQQQLKKTVNALQASHAELERAQMHLIHSAKMQCIGTLAAGVAHEVKNPLQTILIGVDYLMASLPKPAEDVAVTLSDMRDAVRRANTIIRELLELSADNGFALSEGDLNEVVERSLRLMNSEIAAARVDVVRCLEPPLPRVRMDARKLEQVLLNLFINALQAMPQEGTLRVTTRSGLLGANLQLNGSVAAQFRAGERLVVAEVQDTGPGIAREHLARVFDPFFTTKPAGVGTGLGLSIVKKIIDLHAGAVEIRNAPEGGVVVTLAFPV